MSYPELGRFQKEFIKDWSSINHKVLDVIDGQSGLLLPYERVFTGTRAEVFERRGSAKATLNSETPSYRCSYCHKPVSIVSVPEREAFFFRHRKKEGRDCPYENKAPLTHEEVRARQYNGAKESALHLRMKEILRRSLELDGSVQEVYVEKTVKGIAPGTWRKPDVRAVLKDGRTLVFEVQLSSTFLDVMKERLAFYQENGTTLIWVFAHANIEDPRIVLEDVFYGNNRNIFVANEATLQASVTRNECVLQCLYVTPKFDRYGSAHTSSWRSEEVALQELQTSPDLSKTYAYDFDGEKGKAYRGWRSALIDTLVLRWKERYNYDENRLEESDWGELCEILERHEINLPPDPSYISYEALARLSGLLSAYCGEPMGYRYKRLISVAHYFFDSAPHALLTFGHALRTYGRFDQLLAEDKTGKWKPKQSLARENLLARHKDYVPRMSEEEWRMYRLLFPGVVHALPDWCTPDKSQTLIAGWYLRQLAEA